MSIETEIYPLLTQHPAMAGIKVYPRRLSEGTAFPAIVYYQAAGAPENAQEGQVRHIKMRVDCWALNLDSLLSTAAAVSSVLNFYNSGAMSSVLENEVDADDPDSGMFRRVLEFDVWERST